MALTGERASVATQIMEPVAPPPSDPDRSWASEPPTRPSWLAFAAAGLVIIGLVIGAILAAGVLVASVATVEAQGDATGPIESSELAVPTETPAPQPEAAAETAAATEQPVEPIVVDPTPTLLAFGRAWNEGDWEQMRTIATDDVVTVARQWHDNGAVALLTEDRMVFILSSCWQPTPDATSCQMLAEQGEGHALIFNFGYARSGDGVRLVALDFAGDAG